jgi:hypothetical protein
MNLSATAKEAVADAEGEISQEEATERVLALPDLEHAKTAVLNTLKLRIAVNDRMGIEPDVA